MTISEFINRVGFRVDESTVNQVNSTISDIKATATKVLGAIGIGFSLANMNALVEEFDAINDKINFAVSGLGDVKEAQKGILDAANAVKTSYSDMASVVTNLVKSGPEMFPVDQAISFSTNLTKLMKSAGRNDAEIASIMEGMNKSFQKGAIDTETLNIMLEQAPETANYLAERVGVARTNLLQMATDGTLTVNDLRDAFVASSDKIDAAFGQLNYGVSDALLNIRNKFGFFLKETDEMLGLTQTIGKVMVKGFDMAMGAINSARNAVMWLSDKLGGTENLFKLIAIAVGAAVAAMSFGKVTSGLSSILKLIKSINLKMLSIVAVIVLVALLVEDFINFMQGNDSVIGTLLANAGVDVDKFRQNVIKIWENIKTILSAIWTGIKNVAIPIFQGIWTAIQTVFKAIGSIIEAVAPKFAEFIDSIADGEIDLDAWIKVGEAIAKVAAVVIGAIAVVKNINTVMKAAKTIVKGISAAIAFLTSPIGLVIAAIAAVAAVLYDLFNFMNGKDSVIGPILEKLGVDTEAVREKMTAAWESIKGFLLAAWNVIRSVATSIFGGLQSFWGKHSDQVMTNLVNTWNIIKGVLSLAWNAIKGLATAVFGALSTFWNTWGGTITTIFKGAWNVIKTVFGAALDVLADLFAVFSSLFAGDWSELWMNIQQLCSDIWNGILNVISTILTAIWNVLSSIWSTIWGFLSGILTSI